MRSSLRIWTAVLVGLIPFVLPPDSFAQQSITLPGITVQGASLETSRPVAALSAPSEESESAADAPKSDAAGIAREKIGSAVTVVTADDLRAQQVRHLGDALRSLPGVSVSRSGGPGNLTQVRIRGAEANHTLVLIDGIEANATSDGDFDFATLSTEDIERIEVIRGAQSGLYGSKAIGGVINVVTKGGKGPLAATVRAEGGAYGSHDMSARISGGSDRAWFAASLQGRGAQYFNNAPIGTEEDPWHSVAVSLRGGFTLMHGVTIDFSVRNVDRRLHFDNDVVPVGGTLTRQTDAANVSDFDTFLGGVNLRWNTFGGALTHVLSANRNITEVASTTVGLFGGYSNNLSEIDKLSYLATYRFATSMFLAAKHSVSGLLQKELESFRPLSDSPPGPFTPDGITRERSRLATVGEYRGEFFDRVFLTASLRHDDNDKFQDYTTWRTALSLNLREVALRPHASFGTGVALPGMFEQFGAVFGVFKGNPDLKPEESRSWDAGVEFTLLKDRAVLDVTYFRSNLTNEIIGFGDTITNLVGESQRRGVEFELRAKLVPWLMVGVSYTFLDATEPDGSREIRRPRNAARADVTYLFGDGRGTLNFSAIYNGDMRDRNFGTFPATVVTLDDYWLLSAALTYKVQAGVELFGRVENLLDTRYEEVSGYNTPGIAAFAGVRFTFGGPDGLAWAK